MEENNITQTGINGLKGIRGEDLYYNGYSQQQLLDAAKQAKSLNYNATHGHLGYDALYNPSLITPRVLDSDTVPYTYRLSYKTLSGFDWLLCYPGNWTLNQDAFMMVIGY